jgi:hypothetical protein
MFSLVLWLQSNPYQHIGDLDSFQEHVLLVVVGALVTSVGTLVFYIIRQSTDREQRARDRAALTAQMVEWRHTSSVQNNDLALRLTRMEQILTGIDGQNGLKGDVEQMERTMLRVRRLLLKIAAKLELDDGFNDAADV